MDYLLVPLVILIDQIVKYSVAANFTLYESRPVIPGVFYLTYTHNPGAAFGILAHRQSFFLAVTVLMLAGIVYFLVRTPAKEKLLRFGLLLTMGGAVGNAIDRVRFGYVVDMFDFLVWPVFNVADSAIVIGMCLVALHLFWGEAAKGG